MLQSMRKLQQTRTNSNVSKYRSKKLQYAPATAINQRAEGKQQQRLTWQGKGVFGKADIRVSSGLRAGAGFDGL